MCTIAVDRCWSSSRAGLSPGILPVLQQDGMVVFTGVRLAAHHDLKSQAPGVKEPQHHMGDKTHKRFADVSAFDPVLSLSITLNPHASNSMREFDVKFQAFYSSNNFCCNTYLNYIMIRK